MAESSKKELLQQKQYSKEWDYPHLSIVTFIYNPPLEILKELVDSIYAQTYDNWLWYLVDASNDQVNEYLATLADNDSRIYLTSLERNLGISENTNIALRQTQGDFIILLDHDDTLAPFALYEIAKVIREHPHVDYIYSDTDKLDHRGKRCEPFLKPDWSPAMLLSVNYMTQVAVFRKSLLETVGYLNPEFDGSQDWDFVFRVIEETSNIYHIPKILYHSRKTKKSLSQSPNNKPDIKSRQKTLIQQHLQRMGMREPKVKHERFQGVSSLSSTSTWALTKKHKISIIIPSLDHTDILENCLVSIFTRTDYPHYEIILVDTGSKEQETELLYKQYSDKARFKLVYYQEPFNFSRACNFGAKYATGDLLLFLNNDIEVLNSDWLERLSQWFEFEQVGIVGAKLLYPNHLIQHAGVIIGLGGLASHIFAKQKENTIGVFGSDSWYRNYLAVTGACLMISRKVFDQVGGFDEEFVLNFSDVDLCLRARQMGYQVVYTPDARLIHHESLTHQGRIPQSDFFKASEAFAQVLQDGDPFYNPNLTVLAEIPRFRLYEKDNPSESNQRMLNRLPEKEIIQLPDDLLG